jgi:hypothetical protein
LLFLFEDNFCVYPAQYIEPALWVAIQKKSTDLVQNFKENSTDRVREHNTTDWLGKE